MHTNNDGLIVKAITVFFVFCFFSYVWIGNYRGGKRHLMARVDQRSHILKNTQNSVLRGCKKSQ